MSKLFNRSKMFVSRNVSTILTCIGGVGVVLTAVVAVKATPKALKCLEQAKEEKKEELTTFEVVKTAGPVYIPAAVIGVSTIVCIFGANTLNKRQQAALMSAYALLDNSYKDYKKKVEELYGEGADMHVMTEVAKDKYVAEEDNPDYDGKELYYDLFSERYFRASSETVLKAQYAVNRKIHMEGSACLNDFYRELDIEATPYGEYLGWSSGTLMDITWNDWLEFYHNKTEFDDGLECCMISMSLEPLYDFEYY